MSALTDPDDEQDAAPEITTGDIVTDDESNDDRAVVVNVPPHTASEWNISGGYTVAHDNPDYPAHDGVALVFWEDDFLRVMPDYSGKWYCTAGHLNSLPASYYAFPASRLTRVGSVGKTRLRLSEIDPSPYHARTFRADENQSYISQIRREGTTEGTPFVRAVDGRYEIIDGHKRIWGANVAGLDTVWCNVHYMSDLGAAQEWARRHLADYDADPQSEAIARLRENLGDEHTADICEMVGMNGGSTDGG